MAIRFHINDYVFAHGHKPRGFGVWAFSFSRGGAPYIVNPACSFSDAKRHIAAMAKKKGIVDVWVCS